MSVYSDFQKFVNDLEASNTFKNWCTGQTVDCAAWKTYRTALLTTSPPPSTPTMGTSFGKALADVGRMAVDAGLVPPPPPPPPQPLTAAFFFVVSGTTVAFTDTSTPGPSGLIATWHWTFGDGATSTAQNPSHIYAANGTYTVSLTVTSPDGSSSVTHSVATTGVAPTASFTETATGLTVAFTDGSIPGSSGTITSRVWNFGDGNTSTSTNPSHTYAADGTYNVTLTVTGGGSDGSDSTSSPVTVAAVTPPPPPPSAGGVPGIGVYDLGGGLANISGTNINVYHDVIGDAWDNIVKIQNCAGRGLVYFNPTVVGASYSRGVTYADALANGWILQCGGSACTNPVFSVFGANIGSSSYQAKFISNILAYLAKYPGIDGVFLDSIILDPKLTFGSYPNLYPDTAAYSAAMISFMTAFYSALHSKGYYVGCNAGAYIPGDATFNDGTSTINWFKRVAPHCDAMMTEYYQENSGGAVLNHRRSLGSSFSQHWDGWQRLIPTAQNLGKAIIANMYNDSNSGATDAVQRVYGKASFLLEWNGGDSVFAFKNTNKSDPTAPDWTKNMGAPSGAKTQVGIGWRRDYANGTALVNPSPSASQAFTVGVTTHTLAPMTGLIL